MRYRHTLVSLQSLLLCTSRVSAIFAFSNRDNKETTEEAASGGVRNLTNAELLDALDTLLSDVVPQDPDSHNGGLLWRDLSVTTSSSQRQNTTLLHPASGFIPNGKLCAILGPSGSGKSTLLAALAGRSRHTVDGHVIYSMTQGGSVPPKYQSHPSEYDDDNDGDEDWEDEQDDYVVVSPDPSQVAWLSQSDHFFSMLSPRETLYLAAFLELPHWQEDERQNLVQMQLESIGLAHVADHLVGTNDDSSLSSLRHRLSGGERRRLSVALELLTHELFLLADEPTSGLDSNMAVTCMKLIRLQARQRQIPALCALHQPRSSVWHQLVDYVLLMAPGGYVCYCGPRQDCLPYFDSIGYPCPELTNPAEFLVDLVSISSNGDCEEEIGCAEKDRARIQYLAHAFRKHQEKHWKDPQFAVPILSSSFSASRPTRRPKHRLHRLFQKRPLFRIRNHVNVMIHRFGALLRRSFRQNSRSVVLHLFRVVASMGNAVLLSKIFPSVGLRGSPPLPSSVADRVALLSFGAINMAFLAFVKAVTVFAEERPVVHREQTRKQYSALEYLSAKVLAELPMDSLFAAIFTTALKWFSGVRISWGQVTGTFALLTASTASLGYMISSWVPPSEKLAITASIPIMVLLMVVGVINPSGTDPSIQPHKVVQVLKSMSPFRFAIEALCLGEYPGMDFKRGRKGGWFQRLKGLPRMGGLALVQNGDQVIEALGLRDQTYQGAMTKLALLTARFLGLSWLGLQFQEWLSAQRPASNSKSKTDKKTKDKSIQESFLGEKSGSKKPLVPLLRARIK